MAKGQVRGAQGTATVRAKRVKAGPRSVKTSSKINEVLLLAGEKGLLSGARTLVIRGRMPVELVAQAKRRTGITSDSKLLEAALANIALADDYAEWLISQRGTVSAELDLEF